MYCWGYAIVSAVTPVPGGTGTGGWPAGCIASVVPGITETRRAPKTLQHPNITHTIPPHPIATHQLAHESRRTWLQCCYRHGQLRRAAELNVLIKSAHKVMSFLEFKMCAVH